MNGVCEECGEETAVAVLDGADVCRTCAEDLADRTVVLVAAVVGGVVVGSFWEPSSVSPRRSA